MTGIPQDEYAALVEKYGSPRQLDFEADFQDFECELVEKSAARGRQHDITCFIPKDGGYVTIQKHDYANTGIFRAPSGGAKSNESIEDAAVREMKEETGYDVKLNRFVLDLKLDVVCRSRSIIWRSLVFLADIVGGQMKPIDTREIYDVKISSREEMLGPIADKMEKSGWGGFEYRAFLTKKFFSALDRNIRK
ncbi:NUDIX hydrolase [Candidatus Thorarchaeota archaeon]|nr:MAG: NUDIX hydrolase [Candidatus Thorarchaeota archaeon]